MIPTTSIILRTFMISTVRCQGTAFTLDVNDKRYLITAQHVVSDVPKSVNVRTLEGWNELNVDLVAKSGSDDDLAVLRPASRLHEHTLKVFVADPDLRVSVGHDVLLLGFPDGIFADDLRFSDFPHPLALSRKLHVSGISRGQWILDGFANPGFSGGPVFIMLGGNPILIGVVTARQLEQSDINLNGGPTGLSVNVNSGLVFASQIHRAMDLIRKTPNGLPLQ